MARLRSKVDWYRRNRVWGPAWLAGPALRAYTLSRPRTVSAMIRIRNEEEFLEPAVDSIAHSVDEIVLVDNLSTDSTPEVIERLRRRYPDKVRAYVYPHRIARPGDETRRLAATPDGLRSPLLLANYYNWCLERCTTGFVLKWDADMVATSAFEQAAEDFRSSRATLLWFYGANLHPDGEHLIEGRPFTDDEPRIFERTRARYDNGFEVMEALTTPDQVAGVGIPAHIEAPAYVHLRFCKRDAFANLSADRADAERDLLNAGPEIAPGVRDAVVRWRLVDRRLS